MKEKYHHCGGAASLYESLSAAVADINEGVIRVQRPEGGKVAVTADRSGRAVLRLLEDVTESAQLQIQTDAKLVLDGHSLTFTGDGCLTFAAGTNCQIDGQAEDSMIRKEITAEAAGRYLIRTYGDHLLVRGGAYRVEGYYPGGSMVIHATDTCKLLEVLDCQVSATHEGDQTDAGVKTIQTQAEATVVKNAQIIAQSGGYSHAVFGQGTVKIDGSTLDAVSGFGEAHAVEGMSGSIDISDTTANATSSSGPARTICGRNNSTAVNIERSSLHAHSDNGTSDTIHMVSGTVTVDGSSLDADSDVAYVGAIYGGLEKITVTNSNISVRTAGEEMVHAYGIVVPQGCTLNANNTTILADAKGANATRGPISIAICNNGTAYIENVTLNGTHSGIQNGGGAKLYVSGGTYTGYCHGGIYFAHGPEGEGFVNDATLRGGHYEGIYDTYPQSVRYGAMYIGGGSGENNSNMTAYMDHCVFDGTDVDAYIVVRGSSGEYNNVLNVSNGTLVGDTKWIRVDRVDQEDQEDKGPLRINIGTGGNITESSLKDFDGTDPTNRVDYVMEGRAVFNDELYRRHHDGHICTGRDYMALKAMVEAKLSA